MKWPEVTLLVALAICGTVASALNGFDPLAVYTGILGWGGARGVQAAGQLEVRSPVVKRQNGGLGAPPGGESG